MGIERKWQKLDNRTIDLLSAKKAHPHICATKKCDLCLCEKLLITRANSLGLLDKCDELISKCRCMNNFTLKHETQCNGILLLSVALFI